MLKSSQRLSTFVFAILVFLVLGFATAVQAQNYVNTIRDIQVQGVERIEPATVLSYLNLKAGDQITRNALDDSVKALFATGLFADVSLREIRPGIVAVRVVENPIINRIAFEGNDKIEDDELLSEIQLRPRQVFTRTKVQTDAMRLNQIYRRTGRFSVDIEPKIIRLDQNRVDLVFEIDEGPLTKVKSIRFVGNRTFGDDELRSVISTKETVWYRFITADDRYDADRLSFDEELLRRFYAKNGYADFRLSSSVAELSNDKENFFVTFTLEEGPRYAINDVRIDSQLPRFDASILQDDIEFESGDWYDAEEMQNAAERMTNTLADAQYAFVTVRPDVVRNRNNQTVDIIFHIDESPRVFVERIDIQGNSRTMDEVVRREIQLVEGDPFNRTKLAESEQDIRDLDYFETVQVSARQGTAPDRTIVDVEVEEKSTGELSVGAGFSTADGPLADFRIRERNLLGRGQDLLLATTISGERTEYDLSFTEPYFFRRDLAAGFDLFHVTRDLQDESSFDQVRTGGALRMSYPLSDKWRQTWRYRAERNDIRDIQEGASLFILSQEGERTTSAVSQRLTYDDRDSTLFPTEGFIWWVDTEAAGLGGDAQYVSGKTGGTYYMPVYERAVILSLLGEVGAITGYGDEEVQINERFFLGGTTLRGFERAGIGPRDLVTEDALGGNQFYRGSAELSFPIGLPEELGVKGHAFSDFGSLFEIDGSIPGTNVVDKRSIRATAGLGLSWRSPFGPIRVDLATPLAEEEFDRTEAFRFSFGTRF